MMGAICHELASLKGSTAGEIKGKALQVTVGSKLRVEHGCDPFVGTGGPCQQCPERATANQRAADVALEAWLASDYQRVAREPVEGRCLRTC